MNFLFVFFTNVFPALAVIWILYWIVNMGVRKWMSGDEREDLLLLNKNMSRIFTVAIVAIIFMSTLQATGPRVKLDSASVTYVPERQEVEKQTESLVGPQEEWRNTFQEKIDQEQ
jgi:hypothetical protein